jgi:hypothetical protein
MHDGSFDVMRTDCIKRLGLKEGLLEVPPAGAVTRLPFSPLAAGAALQPVSLDELLVFTEQPAPSTEYLLLRRMVAAGVRHLYRGTDAAIAAGVALLKRTALPQHNAEKLTESIRNVFTALCATMDPLKILPGQKHTVACGNFLVVTYSDCHSDQTGNVLPVFLIPSAELTAIVERMADFHSALTFQPAEVKIYNQMTGLLSSYKPNPLTRDEMRQMLDQAWLNYSDISIQSPLASTRVA